MKNTEAWRPSKFHVAAGVLVPSNDPAEVGPRSRLVATLQARAYQKSIQQHAHGRLVDLGCGKVPLFGLYRHLVSEVTCVDWPNSLHPSAHIDIETDLNAELPLASDRYDTIIATDVLEHLSDPFIFWREAYRILAPGGKIVLGVPFLYWLHEEPHDYFRYTKHRLRRFCEEVQLVVEEIVAYGGPLAVVMDILGKNTPWAAASLQRSFIWLLQSRLGRLMDERQRESFPIGYILVAAKASI